MEEPATAIVADLKLASAAIGGKWKPAILACLVAGPRRFGALRRAVGGVSEKVLAQHLRELEADGIVNRLVRHTVPPEVEYSISRHGLSLCDVVEQMASWGAKHRRFLARQGAR
ncbi:MAG TPA: helix-turn-helix domain-containing protein [Polyangiaceae bacterium]|nr:helix-turn-helix domain-containing protein [Polyangiaceae bacterium]